MKRLLGLALCLLTGCKGDNFLGRHLLGGTSDTGGGNGTGNKVYESYIVDPLTLPAFKVYLEPILKNIDSPKGSQKGETVWQWANLLTYKTWYIAPVQFNTIGREILGISFTQDQTQQLAIQTPKEIWIQKTLFDQMPLRDQADLMVHEFVMNAYFLKYKSLFELCEINSLKGNVSPEDCDIFKTFDEIYPGAVPQPLNSTDYQNIRRVTSFFIREGATASEETIRQTMVENGFDPRWFRRPPARIPTEFEMTGDQIYNLFELARLTNLLPDKCNYIFSHHDADCQLELERKGSGLASYGEVNLIHAGKEMKLGRFYTSNQMKYYVSATINPLSNEIIYVIPLGQGAIVKAKLGERFRFLTISASPKDSARPQDIRLGSVLSTMGVVTKVRDSHHGKVCESELLNPISLQEDSVVVGRELNDMGYLKWMSRYLGSEVSCE